MAKDRPNDEYKLWVTSTSATCLEGSVRLMQFK